MVKIMPCQAHFCCLAAWRSRLEFCALAQIEGAQSSKMDAHSTKRLNESQNRARAAKCA